MGIVAARMSLLCRGKRLKDAALLGNMESETLIHLNKAEVGVLDPYAFPVAVVSHIPTSPTPLTQL